MDLAGAAEKVWMLEALAETVLVVLCEVVWGYLYRGGSSEGLIGRGWGTPTGYGDPVVTEEEDLMSVRAEMRRIDRGNIIAEVVVVVDWIYPRTKW